MAIKTLEEYKKEALNATNAQRQSDKAATEQNYESQKKLVTDTYNKQIDETANSYEDLYRQNAVQKLINEREVAENMANLGLTDSGLNRTQQTAVQLSYSNTKAKYDVSRQKAVDNLAAELANKISTLDTEKLSAIAGIDSNYDNAALSTAQSMRNADIEAETARYKAEQEQIAARYKAEQEQIAATNKAYYAAQQKILSAQAKSEKENSYIIKANGAKLSYDFKGSLKDNGVSVIYGTDGKTTYVDTKSGYKTVMDSTINPYTGWPHEDVVYGTFSNGYQPNNIKGNKLKEVEGARIDRHGRSQRIFTYDNKSYYYWDGEHNKYEKLTDSEKKSLGIK